MSIPNIKLAEKLAEIPEVITIICRVCKEPLWKISEFEKYGTRWAARKEPFPGVPDYSEYWAKDQKTCLRTDCPHCGKMYFEVLETEAGLKFPKLSTLELP